MLLFAHRVENARDVHESEDRHHLKSEDVGSVMRRLLEENRKLVAVLHTMRTIKRKKRSRMAEICKLRRAFFVRNAHK